MNILVHSSWYLVHAFLLHTFLVVELLSNRISIREGNGTPLQHSCLETPMDGGAW